MKILILGCGSIGSRHARNARHLGVRKLVLVDPNIGRARSLGDELGTNLFYRDYKIAVRENPDLDAAVICTPSSLHIQHAIFFAKNNISLLIEKPLSNNLKNTSALLKLAKKNKIIVMMGHSFMFDIRFTKLKSILDKKTIGRIYFASYLNGQYLPEWHPRENYKKEYSARKHLGGGVILTMTSHSFYLLEWLFGSISDIRGSFIGRIGSLKIDVDDSVFLLLRTKDGAVIQSQNNFITPIHQHRLVIDGSKGMIELDFLKQKITIILKGEKSQILPVKIDCNDRFIREMKYFLKALKTKKIQKDLNLDSGIRFLKVVKQLGKFPVRSNL